MSEGGESDTSGDQQPDGELGDDAEGGGGDEPSGPIDYTITPADDLGEGDPKQKYRVILFKHGFTKLIQGR